MSRFLHRHEPAPPRPRARAPLSAGVFARDPSGNGIGGLDQAQIVDSLEVRWPSGQVNTFRNLQVNRLYVVSEGAKTPQVIALR